ncbi:MAG: hypothetical protein Q4F28_11845 [Eubacteriales bacterium]|nr:hypothetical protein [Eubacteriales bacterium]
MFGIKLNEELSEKEMLEAIAHDVIVVNDSELDKRVFELSFGFKYTSKKKEEMEKAKRMDEWMKAVGGIKFQSRPISYTSILNGQLMKQGYSFYDIQMSMLLNEKDELKDTNGEAYKFASGTLEPSEEQLALWRNVAAERKKLGKKFVKHYKEPEYLCRYVADAWMGWQSYSLGVNLEKHLGREITPDNYAELLQNPADALQVMAVAAGMYRHSQQFLQATEIMSIAESQSMFMNYKGVDYSHGGKSPLHEQLLEQFTEEDLRKCSDFYLRWTEPAGYMLRGAGIMSISNAISNLERPEEVLGEGNQTFQDAIEFLKDAGLDENGSYSGIRKPVSEAGIFHVYDVREKRILRTPQEEQEYAEYMLDATRGSESMSSEARRRIRSVYMGRSDAAKNYMEQKKEEEERKKEKRVTLPRSVWSRTSDECISASGLKSDLENQRKALERYQKNIEDMIPGVGTEDEITPADRDRLLDNVKKSRKTLDAIWQQHRARASQAEGRVKMENCVARMKLETQDPSRQPGQILTGVQMSAALREAVEGFVAQQNLIGASIDKELLNESEETLKTASFQIDNRDLDDIVSMGIDEGDTNEDITRKAKEAYRLFYHGDMTSRYQVLDDMYDRFDTFELADLDLTCLTQRPDKEDSEREVLNSSEKDLMKLLQITRTAQAVMVKSRENPEYFNRRYPTPEDRMIFNMKQDALVQLSLYINGDFLRTNGFDINLKPSKASMPKESWSVNANIALQQHRMNMAMALGEPMQEGIRIQLPYAEAAMGGHRMADGATVDPSCEMALSRIFSDVAVSALGNNIQLENQEIMGIDKYDMLLVDGVPIKERYADQISEMTVRQQERRMSALAAAAMISGNHRVEMIMSQETVNGIMDFRVVPLIGDIHEYSQKEWESRGMFSRAFGEAPREKLVEELWQKDEHREERHHAALDGFCDKLRNVALERERRSAIEREHFAGLRKEMAEWNRQGEMLDLFASPEMDAYRENQVKWRETLERNRATIRNGHLELDTKSREHSRMVEQKTEKLLMQVSEAQECLDLSADQIRGLLEAECSKKYPDSEKLAFYSRLCVFGAEKVWDECCQEVENFQNVSDMESMMFEEERINLGMREVADQMWTKEALMDEAEGRLVQRNLDMKPQTATGAFPAPATSEEALQEVVRLDSERKTLRPTFQKLREIRGMDIYLQHEENPPFLNRMELRECRKQMEAYRFSRWLDAGEKQSMEQVMQIVDRIVNEPDDAAIKFDKTNPLMPQSLKELRGTMRAMAELAVLKEYDRNRTPDMPEANDVWDTYTRDLRKREFMMETYVTMERENLQKKLEAKVDKVRVKTSLGSLMEEERSMNGSGQQKKKKKPAERSLNVSEAAIQKRKSEAQRTH